MGSPKAAKSGSPLAGLKLVDFGSGDGRIVLEAGSRGVRAVGYELNPYLWLWSSMRRFWSPIAAPGRVDIRLANAWNADLRNVDVLTVYGRPGDRVMERIAKKCAAEMPSESAVVSHLFDLP